MTSAWFPKRDKATIASRIKVDDDRHREPQTMARTLISGTQKDTIPHMIRPGDKAGGSGKWSHVSFWRFPQGKKSVQGLQILESRDLKDHDSQRRDRILPCFLRSEIGQFSPYFRGDFWLTYTENLEKEPKNPLEKIKKIQWRRRPEIADFCPLSWSSERVLRIARQQWCATKGIFKNPAIWAMRCALQKSTFAMRYIFTAICTLTAEISKTLTILAETITK